MMGMLGPAAGTTLDVRAENASRQRCGFPWQAHAGLVDSHGAHRGVDVTDQASSSARARTQPTSRSSGTNRLTDLSGVVTNSRSAAVKDYSVVVFAQDRDKWKDNSRYMRTVRPDQDGRFKVTGSRPASTTSSRSITWIRTSGPSRNTWSGSG